MLEQTLQTLISWSLRTGRPGPAVIADRILFIYSFSLHLTDGAVGVLWIVTILRIYFLHLQFSINGRKNFFLNPNNMFYYHHHHFTIRTSLVSWSRVNTHDLHGLGIIH